MAQTAPEPVELDFYTKRDCPLCDKALVAIDQVRARIPEVPVRIRKHDIETDPEWLEEYGTLIPVVEIDGERHCVCTVSQRRLARRLAKAWKARQASTAKDAL